MRPAAAIRSMVHIARDKEQSSPTPDYLVHALKRQEVNACVLTTQLFEIGNQVCMREDVFRSGIPRVVQGCIPGIIKHVGNDASLREEPRENATGHDCKGLLVQHCKLHDGVCCLHKASLWAQLRE